MEDTKFYQRLSQNAYAIPFVFMAPTSQKLVGHIGFCFQKGVGSTCTWVCLH